ncbi:erythromycin biosynthesis sensory transduction protein eryC1 [Paramagnetospirillum kuznetsovii]|uniref:Erythromycin biosynthesis sensory transduction protein eryC1 n=1 Tax=Paramagnetospirillum kuznetsovii TaxID=2053833 RepID=A0A364NXQ7_9PROT|nr:DegT/DnrJ/EryC1/StrS family aminotransferase [Paramagnetospirillum kuznetsovii]RAU21862.1 erythromycin biosynthesis sensory transduction protein eryC1 [Paramagnetospirillum kuznetsovii]
MKVPFADLGLQYRTIKSEIDAAMARVVETSAFIGGAPVAEFESAFASFLGIGHCIGCGNGTDAIEIALRALGIGPGDEVITAANSFIASSEAITNAGAKVVFVDCDPVTYCLDLSKLRNAITPRVKAIIPVHLYGRPAEMPTIMDMARAHGVKVVEDCAQAHGAKLDGRMVGTFGDVGCFSFYPGKNLGAYGDAGAMVTSDPSLAAKMRMWANHGRMSKYDHQFEGVNSRLDGLQAAVLTVKLGHLDAWTQGRRRAAADYAQGLDGSGLELPSDPPGGRHVHHLYVVRVKDRERVQVALGEAGISSGVHYPVALPNLTAYQKLGHRPKDFPVASRYQDEVLSLPMFPEITAEQIAWVCERLRAVL